METQAALDLMDPRQELLDQTVQRMKEHALRYCNVWKYKGTALLYVDKDGRPWEMVGSATPEIIEIRKAEGGLVATFSWEDFYHLTCHGAPSVDRREEKCQRS